MLLRSIVVAGFALVVPACSPCAFGFCSDAGEGEGEVGEGEGEGEGATPSSSCQDDVQCQVADADFSGGGVQGCRQSSDCGRDEDCAPSTGNTSACVLVLSPADPPCEARSSKQLVTFSAISIEGVQFSFCASPNVFCDNGTCTGGAFSP